MSGVVRIAVLSDLHFSSNAQGAGATYVILDRQEIPKQHPYKDLLDLIGVEGLSVDIVLCPGDITYQADQVALKAAWDALNKVAVALGAKHLLTATGNHDVSSRDVRDASPEIWEFLKSLSPSYPYPAGDKIQWLSYWAQHFLIADVEGIRCVVLNSCNCHSRGGDEWKHGRVTDFTIASIMNELDRLEPQSLNLLLCHHHPAKHPDLSQASIDYSEMTQGNKLLAALRDRDEPWLIVHGHKHSPRIEYAQSASSDAPVIFSAGSLSAVLPPQYFAGATNQFYILEIDLADVAKHGIVGTVEVWDWHEGQGWRRSRRPSTGEPRILDGAGFGYRANVSSMARDIDGFMGAASGAKWTDIVAAFPHLRYVTPPDLDKIKAKLKSTHSVDILAEPEGWVPKELHRAGGPSV